MKNFSLLILVIVLIYSCNRADDSQDIIPTDSIIFGEIYGACVGDCRNLYLLTAQGVYGDANSNTIYGDWENTTFQNQSLAMDQFDLAKPLLQIPDILLSYEFEIGSQIISDFDYFINLRINGTSKTFVFDELKEAIPLEIKNYINNFIAINSQLKK
ncbi:hypothetical protein D1816_16620 [Aquimarina sp. AD10]|uniref:hypothetical protein n=1 Tax=Aquimarina TaxID=290174 RepID=UPI000E555E6D|nr:MULTISPECIES: hypothetical protein [Aquimarina]AXT61909.1 hypothetical protein D1816_16620 [Aquimarina sp. AD10]RKN02369.1 hypothetical protein D7033_00735 [Aquimarina sp. AD10]